jgi:hypothetical protein
MQSSSTISGSAFLPVPELTVGWGLVPAERESQLIRDIFGNPFRASTLAPSHRTLTVVGIAQATYDERQLPSGELDQHRLAVLADALEEVGAPGELVAHLRGPGPHVRGCHVIDLILGLN